MPKQYEQYFRAVPESEARSCTQDEGVYLLPCVDNDVFLDEWVYRWEGKNASLDYCNDVDFYKIRLSDALRDAEEFPSSDRSIIRRIQNSFDKLCDSCRKSIEKDNIWIYTFVVVLPKRQNERRRREHSLREYALGCQKAVRKAENAKKARQRKLDFYTSEFGSPYPVWPRRDQWWKLKDDPKDETLKSDEYAEYAHVLYETGKYNLTLSVGYAYKDKFIGMVIKEAEKYWLMRNYDVLDESPFVSGSF